MPAPPSVVRLLAVLYTVQLACFAAQATGETALGGGYAVHWLLTTVRPALAALRVWLTPTGRHFAAAFAVQAWPRAGARLRSFEIVASAYM